MVYTGAIMAMTKRARAKAGRAKYVRRSVTLPPKIAKQVETLARERDLSDNRVLVELIEQGIEARQQKKRHSSSWRNASAQPMIRNSQALGINWDTSSLVSMPQIAIWSQLPAAIRDHLVERMHDRQIGLDDLNQLRLWMESKPDVPEGPWYKDFGPSNFAARQLPKTFLLPSTGRGRKL